MHREYTDDPRHRPHGEPPAWRQRVADDEDRRHRLEGLDDEPYRARSDDDQHVVAPRRGHEAPERERGRPWSDQDRRMDERRASRQSAGRDEDRREWIGREYREPDAARRRSDAERAQRFDEDVPEERLARSRGTVDPRAYEGPDPYERLRDVGEQDRRETRAGTVRPGQHPGARSGPDAGRHDVGHYTGRPWPPDDRGYAGTEGDRDEPRGRGYFTGRGPRTWQRSDDRIRDEVCEVLTEHPHIDATDVTVSVTQGEVRLGGTVPTRAMRREAEACLDDLPGVRDVRNDLRVGDLAERDGGPARPD